jgi:hypothetical protein
MEAIDHIQCVRRNSKLGSQKVLESRCLDVIGREPAIGARNLARGIAGRQHGQAAWWPRKADAT